MKTTCCSVFLSNVNLFIRWQACEQALWRALAAGREKEGELATSSQEFEYLHRKSQCHMLIGRDDISNDIITLGMCFSMFVYICARFHFALIGRNLTAQLTGRYRAHWKWNSNYRDIVASSPSFSHPIARVPQRAYSQAIRWQNIPLKFQLLPQILFLWTLVKNYFSVYFPLKLFTLCL